MYEIALAELVLDELIGRPRIGHAQQGFGQHHQRQAFLGGKREFPQHVFDAAEPAVGRANGYDQSRRVAVDPGVLFRRKPRRCQQT